MVEQRPDVCWNPSTWPSSWVKIAITSMRLCAFAESALR